MMAGKQNKKWVKVGGVGKEACLSLERSVSSFDANALAA